MFLVHSRKFVQKECPEKREWEGLYTHRQETWDKELGPLAVDRLLSEHRVRDYQHQQHTPAYGTLCRHFLDARTGNPFNPFLIPEMCIYVLISGATAQTRHASSHFKLLNLLERRVQKETPKSKIKGIYILCLETHTLKLISITIAIGGKVRQSLRIAESLVHQPSSCPQIRQGPSILYTKTVAHLLETYRLARPLFLNPAIHRQGIERLFKHF
jgi:hypothetical protein